MADKKKTSKRTKTESDRKKLVTPKELEKGVDDGASAETSFDFGGIPDRNLKKNLGCG